MTGRFGFVGVLAAWCLLCLAAAPAGAGQTESAVTGMPRMKSPDPVYERSVQQDERAQAAFDAGNLKAAEREFAAELRICKGVRLYKYPAKCRIAARGGIARIRWQQKRYREAETLYRQNLEDLWVDLPPGAINWASMETLVAAAQAAMLSGDYDGADALLGRLFASTPYGWSSTPPWSGDAYYLAAMLAMYRGDYVKADSLLKLASGDFMREANGSGIFRIELGNYTGSLLASPEVYEFAADVGYARLQQRKYAEAYTYLSAVTDAVWRRYRDVREVKTSAAAVKVLADAKSAFVLQLDCAWALAHEP